MINISAFYIVLTVIIAIILFAMIIGIHEFGHFITAKKFGVKVNEFALGMGPKLFSRQGKETLYSLRLIPIGGYCAMEGEDEDSDDERALNNKKWWQRGIILAAGAIMNILLGIVFMFIILCSWTSVASGKIPLTMIFVVFIYIGQEVLMALTVPVDGQIWPSAPGSLPP